MASARRVLYGVRSSRRNLLPANSLCYSSSYAGFSTVSRDLAQAQGDSNTIQKFQDAAEDIGATMRDSPGSVSRKDANYLKSREAQATGQPQPPKDSISAEAQRLATANERRTSPKKGPYTPEEQSQHTIRRNFELAADALGNKIKADPDSVTPRDSDLMHRRESRARGQIEKGGITSQAQQLAADNEKKGKV